MEKYAQIFISGGGRDDAVIKDIEAAAQTEGLDKLIIGWADAPKIYRAARECTKAAGKKLFLWLPVFSELKDITGQSPFVLGGGIAAPKKQFTADESFDFCCVSDPDNIEKLLRYYRETFSSYGFDGVFLDRIRYPSLNAGLDTFFGCTCPHCRTAYEKQGLSFEEVEAAAKRIKAKIADKGCNNPLGLAAYADGRWSFEDDGLCRLLEAKCGIIEGSVTRLVSGLRSEVSEIGLDMFAPFLSPFVGQSYDRLPKLADFVKPMLYRYTDTPAGFRFELRRMAEAISTKETRAEREAFLLSLLNVGDKEDLTELMCSELTALKALGDKAVPGIELHTAEGLPPISGGKISENLKLLCKHGFKAATACWNILEADERNRSIFFSYGDEK